jgi:hypothetical protein
MASSMYACRFATRQRTLLHAVYIWIKTIYWQHQPLRHLCASLHLMAIKS